MLTSVFASFSKRVRSTALVRDSGQWIAPVFDALKAEHLSWLARGDVEAGGSVGPRGEGGVVELRGGVGHPAVAPGHDGGAASAQEATSGVPGISFAGSQVGLSGGQEQ